MAFTNPKKKKSLQGASPSAQSTSAAVENSNDDTAPRDKQRRSKKQHDDDDDEIESSEPESSSFFQDFVMNRPFTVLALLVVVPYVLRSSYYFFLLQRPDLLQTFSLGLIRLRPAVGDRDARQVLIVGSMGSNVEQLASALSDTLDLEVGLETMNAKSDFCRDGTVSTFLGVRFAPQRDVSDDDENVVNSICAQRIKGSAANAANSFTPQNYASSSAQKCSMLDRTCWTRTCQAVLKEQWGCGASKEGCLTPFVRTIWQVQHPLRTIQQLVAKVCPRMKSQLVHPSFRQMAVGFLPDHNISSRTISCLKTVATYVLNYHTALLEQTNNGVIHSVVQYETTSWCQIVRLAGFLDQSSPLYDAARAAWLDRKCPQDATNVILSSSTQVDKAILLPNITWDSLELEIGLEHVESLKRLTQQLGYKDLDEAVTTLRSNENNANMNSNNTIPSAPQE